MDLNFVPNIVKNDYEARYPAAERWLRDYNGKREWNHSTNRFHELHVPRISDYASIIRSLSSYYSTSLSSGKQSS
jgi:hypothetical protein